MPACFICLDEHVKWLVLRDFKSCLDWIVVFKIIVVRVLFGFISLIHLIQT
ncbi:hypothetical protein HanPSC8_Chr16g0695691 [Helianthus annuus]|nr:hypothetical protein HanPSC8_Chr16g0695691 [Helianthus annuus]